MDVALDAALEPSGPLEAPPGSEDARMSNDDAAREDDAVLTPEDGAEEDAATVEDGAPDRDDPPEEDAAPPDDGLSEVAPKDDDPVVAPDEEPDVDPLPSPPAQLPSVHAATRAAQRRTIPPTRWFMVTAFASTD